MSVRIEGESLLGTRDEQQDYYLYRVADDVSMAVVCDGMGGMQGGAVASELACVTLKEDVKKALPIEDYSTFLKKEALRLDEKVFELVDNKGQWLGAGTTITTVLIQKNEMYFMSVGDSRMYISRNDDMIPLNREHNYRLQLDCMLENHQISREGYESELKGSEALISYLGMGNISIMDVNRKPFILENGDKILLCSDGITKIFSEEEIRDIMTMQKSPKELVTIIRKLIHSKEIKSQDNTTYVIVEYWEGEA